MATVSFLYRSTKERAPLTLRLLFRYKGQDVVLASRTQLTVEKKYWERQHRLKKSSNTEVVRLQKEITEELQKIERHLLKAFDASNTGAVDKKWLENQLKHYYHAPAEAPEMYPADLIAYIDTYLTFKRNEIKPSTEKKIKVIKQLLKRYVLHTQKPLQVKDVDVGFKMSFESYCLEQRYAPNTISTAFKFIKVICNHARSNGIATSLQLNAIKSKQVKVEHIYLTFEELTAIGNISASLLAGSLLDARDWLVISCYTGQRISDFMRFSCNQVRLENGKYLLEFTQVKTDKIMTVPLHRKVLDILENRSWQFPPPMGTEKYNACIKKVCEMAGLDEMVLGSKKSETEQESGIYRNETRMFRKWELVTSHIGRRSFATNFYGQIPTAYLIYVTGHSTEQMFLTYINKSSKDLAMELVNYF